jgi:hypothetical protein
MPRRARFGNHRLPSRERAAEGECYKSYFLMVRTRSRWSSDTVASTELVPRVSMKALGGQIRGSALPPSPRRSRHLIQLAGSTRLAMISRAVVSTPKTAVIQRMQLIRMSKSPSIP